MCIYTMKDLKEYLMDAIEDWRYRKLSNIELDSDTDFEIHQEVQSTIKEICEKLKDLEDDIDSLVEQMSEPSNYEFDMEEDERTRFKELREVM